MTIDEALAWAERGDINAGERTREALWILAREVRYWKDRADAFDEREEMAKRSVDGYISGMETAGF